MKSQSNCKFPVAKSSPITDNRPSFSPHHGAFPRLNDLTHLSSQYENEDRGGAPVLAIARVSKLHYFTSFHSFLETVQLEPLAITCSLLIQPLALSPTPLAISTPRARHGVNNVPPDPSPPSHPPPHFRRQGLSGYASISGDYVPN